MFFIDNETGHYLEPIYGRCDRESACGYFKAPTYNKRTITSFKKPIYNPPTFINENVIGKYCNNYDHNNFVSFLLKHHSEKDVIQAIENYFIGTTNHWKGATIFWQIDEKLKIHTGKVMLYDRITGRRVKKPYAHVNWMHKVLQIKPFVLQQCLFGLHLISEGAQKKTICIVESEKTAIIMSLVFPEYYWMATGSKSNLKIGLLLPIKNFKIILYPDKTEYQSWNEKAAMLDKNGFSIKCSRLIESIDVEVGGDLADLYLAFH